MKTRRALRLSAAASGLALRCGTASAITLADFGYGGPETGAFATPYNTLTEGVDFAAWGGSVHFKPGPTPERRTIAKPLTLRAPFGPVTLGQ